MGDSIATSVGAVNVCCDEFLTTLMMLDRK